MRAKGPTARAASVPYLKPSLLRLLAFLDASY